MSNQQSIYIGAYLLVHLKPYNTVDAVWECPEHGNISYIAEIDKLCPTCGNKLIKLFHGKEKYCSYVDLFEDFDDDLIQIDNSDDSDDSEMILISDIYDKAHISLDNDDEGVYSLEDANEYTQRFCENFNPQIQQIIKNEYVINVLCKFGVVINWY